VEPRLISALEKIQLAYHEGQLKEQLILQLLGASRTGSCSNIDGSFDKERNSVEKPAETHPKITGYLAHWSY
jgi:hypothetical protein